LKPTDLASTTLALSVGLLALALGVSLALWGGAVALGVLAGGGLTIGSYAVLAWSVRRMLARPGASHGLLLAVLVLKLVVLAGLLTLVVWSGRVHILGLFLGCSVVVLSVMALAALLAVRTWTGDK
jgi:hypothetical protein